jgi:hypothetical protein
MVELLTEEADSVLEGLFDGSAPPDAARMMSVASRPALTGEQQVVSVVVILHSSLYIPVSSCPYPLHSTLLASSLLMKSA